MMFDNRILDFSHNYDEKDFIKMLVEMEIQGIKDDPWFYVEIGSNLFHDYDKKLSNPFSYVRRGMHIKDLLEIRKLANLVTSEEFKDIVLQCPKGLDAEGVVKYCIENFNKVVYGYIGDDLQYFLVFRGHCRVNKYSDYVFNLDYCIEGNPDYDDIVRDWASFLVDSFVEEHGDWLCV